MEKIEIIRAQVEKWYNDAIELMMNNPNAITAAEAYKFVLDLIEKTILESK